MKKAKTKSIKKRVVKKIVKKPKIQRAVRTRNAGTQTEAQFFSMIRESLRQKSRWWKPILNVKNKARIPYKGPNKRRKWTYICQECKGENDSKTVNVHHTIECGSLSCFEDIAGFCERLFVEEEGLILLCHTCHLAKHTKTKEIVKL